MVSDRFAYLLPRPHPPCICHTQGERCICAAPCLNHTAFPSAPPAPEETQ